MKIPHLVKVAARVAVRKITGPAPKSKFEMREYPHADGSTVIVEVEILPDGTERVVRRGRFMGDGWTSAGRGGLGGNGPATLGGR